jgi:hypothetical protein
MEHSNELCRQKTNILELNMVVDAAKTRFKKIKTAIRKGVN